GGAAGALGLALAHPDREGAGVAALDPAAAEVVLEHRAGGGVLLQQAGDVPGGGAQLGHLARILRRRGDGLLGLLLGGVLRRLLGGRLLGGRGRGVALVLLLVVGEPCTAHPRHHDHQQQGEQQAAAAGVPGAPAGAGAVVLVGIDPGGRRAVVVRRGRGGRGRRRRPERHHAGV